MTDLTAVRIQRSRAKGWRMPEGAVYVGRPSQWGNPFWLTSHHPIEVAASVDQYRRWLRGEIGLGADPADGRRVAKAARKLLRGKDLACWCPLDQPCHADVLLEMAG